MPLDAIPLDLTAVEQRVLGVLIEKGYTTPERYPLTLNAAVDACNQKSCREPVLDLDEATVLDALENLRDRKLVVRIRPADSRADRYRQCARDIYGIDDREASILAELLLRGPQTDGELRQRASRMIPTDRLEETRASLDGLRVRMPALVRRLSPEGRTRGVVYAHALGPQAEAEGEGDAGPRVLEARPAADIAGDEPTAELVKLREEVEALRERVARIEARLADDAEA